MQETEPTVYSPYPRRPERLTICRYNGAYTVIERRPPQGRQVFISRAAGTAKKMDPELLTTLLLK